MGLEWKERCCRVRAKETLKMVFIMNTGEVRDLKNGVHMILGITKIVISRFFRVTDFVNLKITQTKTMPREITTKRRSKLLRM